MVAGTQGRMSEVKLAGTAVCASLKYGESYAWGTPERFSSVAAVLRELADPGCETGHPRSYFPVAGGWNHGDTVAWIDATGDPEQVGDCPDLIVTVGPRGGLRAEVSA